MKIKRTIQQIPLSPPLLVASVSGCTSWDEWLEKTELSLKDIGYRKYTQSIKNEDFAYWKTFKGYQVGVFFYDFRKHQNQFRIGVQFECRFTDIDARIDLSVCKDISLEQFEIMAKTFIDTMSQYCG
jgi:hypothetical protein